MTMTDRSASLARDALALLTHMFSDVPIVQAAIDTRATIDRLGDDFDDDFGFLGYVHVEALTVLSALATLTLAVQETEEAYELAARALASHTGADGTAHLVRSLESLATSIQEQYESRVDG